MNAPGDGGRGSRAWKRRFAESLKIEQERAKDPSKWKPSDLSAAREHVPEPEPDADEELAPVFEEAIANAEIAHKRWVAHAANCARRPCHTCRLAVCVRCSTEVDYDRLPSNTRTQLLVDEPVRAVCPTCRPLETRVVRLANARITVPPLFTDRRFETPGIQPTVLWRRPAAANFMAIANQEIDGPGISLVGDPGGGKTTLLACMFNELLDRASRLDAPAAVVARAAGAFWIAAPKLGRAYSLHPLGVGAPPEIDRARDATVLVIDSVGLEDARSGAFREIIFERHERGLPTWCSYDIPCSEVGLVYGGGTHRRVFELLTTLQFEKEPTK